MRKYMVSIFIMLLCVFVSISIITSHKQNLMNYTIAASNSDNDRDQGFNGEEGNLRYWLNEIRKDFPKAQISTFTCKPLIGGISYSS